MTRSTVDVGYGLRNDRETFFVGDFFSYQKVSADSLSIIEFILGKLFITCMLTGFSDQWHAVSQLESCCPTLAYFIITCIHRDASRWRRNNNEHLSCVSIELWGGNIYGSANDNWLSPDCGFSGSSTYSFLVQMLSPDILLPHLALAGTFHALTTRATRTTRYTVNVCPLNLIDIVNFFVHTWLEAISRVFKDS